MIEEVREDKSEETDDLIIDDFMRPLIDAFLVIATGIDV